MHVKLRNRRAYVMRSIQADLLLPIGLNLWVPMAVSESLHSRTPSWLKIVAVGREGTVLTLDVR